MEEKGKIKERKREERENGKGDKRRREVKWVDIRRKGKERERKKQDGK